MRIAIQARGFSIEREFGRPNIKAQGDDDYGFGLGLELVSLTCKRFAWRYTTTELPAGRATVVGF